MYSITLTASLLFALFCLSRGQTFSESRVGVKIIDEQYILVLHSKAGELFWSLEDRNQDEQADPRWYSVSGPKGVAIRSNPVLLELPNRNMSVVFVQGEDGQVYRGFVTVKTAKPVFSQWQQVANNLPADEGARLKGFDSVAVHMFQNQMYVFARSLTNSSHLYWSALSEAYTWSEWKMLGGGKALLNTDMAIAYNSFSKLLEAFMVSTDGYLYRSWQLKFDRWSSWTKTGYWAPKSDHAPVVHEMSSNMFNGKLNVFVHARDGTIHHIWQTTCDKVPNIWGWCTWSYWYTIGGSMPPTPEGVSNTLAIGNNIHLGIELFTTDVHGQVYKMWQIERHGKWSSWELVKGMSEYKVSNLVRVVDDITGWWAVYALNAEHQVLMITQHKELSVETNSVRYGGEVAVSWQIPVDEASHNDWIGIYPHGTDNRNYVDFYYVGGGQNPYQANMPTGEIKFTTYLPRGKYDVRYLPNRRYISAVSTPMVITTNPTEEAWVQVFHGLFRGFNLKNVSVETCVKDATDIEKDFELALTAFKERSIIKGLNMLGEVMKVAAKGMKDCGIMNSFVKRIEGFVADAVSCYKGNCLHFLIDIGKEILVLYENIYEIYGDMISAHNAFKMKAYSQGGYNVGRVVNACLALPR